MTTTDKDYYAILGVDAKADAEAIKKAYRKLAKQYHPDANPGNPRASERFKEVGEANSVLSDPRKRAKYDQMRKLGAFGFGGSRPGARPGGQQASNFSFEDLGGLGGFSDIFSSIFDRGRKEEARKPSGPAKGANIDYTVEVPFLVAARGGKVPIAVPINEECATCGGSGGAPGTTWKKCDECGGAGTVSFGQGGFAVSRPCPACVGRGERPETECGACGGEGKIHQERNIQVSVPAGVDTGSRVRLSGQGERGTKGGPRRPRHHLQGHATPLLSPRRKRRPRDGADQPGPGDARVEDPREHDFGQEGGAAHPARYATRDPLPDPGTGD